MNLIPLIDVIMFLLIFFISTTSMMEDKGVLVDKPKPGGSSQSDSQSIVLAVTSDGKINDGREIGINGVRPTVKRLCVKEPLPVVIQTDENSHSGTMIRVIDEAKMGGAKDVSLAMEKS